MSVHKETRIVERRLEPPNLLRWACDDMAIFLALGVGYNSGRSGQWLVVLAMSVMIACVVACILGVRWEWERKPDQDQ